MFFCETNEGTDKEWLVYNGNAYSFSRNTTSVKGAYTQPWMLSQFRYLLPQLDLPIAQFQNAPRYSSGLDLS